MKTTKTVFLSLLVLAFGVMTAVAAEHTWTGKISDSMCGANHKKGAEHGSTTMSDRDCTLGCVKNGGKFVFVYKGTISEWLQKCPSENPKQSIMDHHWLPTSLPC